MPERCDYYDDDDDDDDDDSSMFILGIYRGNIPPRKSYIPQKS